MDVGSGELGIAEVGIAEIWLHSMFFSPLMPCFQALFEQIKMLLICRAVHLLVVVVIDVSG